LKKKVWIDTDLSVGMKRQHREGFCDVDDGYAVLQLMKSELVEILGISSVFGNTDIDNAFRLSKFMSDEFYRGEIPVHRGAAKAIDLKKVESNPAVEALAAALRKQKLTIMAIGPATNIGLLLLLYPELKFQIEEVVLVAGRRKPSDFFLIGTAGNHAPDLNFDLDNDAFRAMFEAKVNITLCPFEISNKVWIKEEDLQRLADADAGAQWLAKHSQPWLTQWLDQGAQGFNPFDVLASHYIIKPSDIISEELHAHLEIHPNDQVGKNQREAFKQYLICDHSPGSKLRYCYDVVDGYHEKLIDSLTKDLTR